MCDLKKSCNNNSCSCPRVTSHLQLDNYMTIPIFSTFNQTEEIKKLTKTYKNHLVLLRVKILLEDGKKPILDAVFLCVVRDKNNLFKYEF